MNITVDYKKRQYGLGDTVRHYKVTLREVNGFYVEKPITGDSKSYDTREVQLCFRGVSSSPGRSWDEWSEAEVLGGTLELSHAAARQLAETILKFLDEKKEAADQATLEIEVDEKPDPRTSLV